MKSSKKKIIITIYEEVKYLWEIELVNNSEIFEPDYIWEDGKLYFVYKSDQIPYRMTCV